MSADDWLRLAHVGMHPDRLRGLIRDSGSPRVVLRSIERGAVKVPEWARQAATVPADVRRSELDSSGIRFVLQSEASFPVALTELPDAPFFLFQRGASVTERALAVVGTRAATAYGRRLATAYGAALSRAGWRVISGLARGIDGAAHRGSLAGGTPGIAVLGSGIDVWYPAEHEALGTELLDGGGTIWSEYPPGTPPTGWRFPPRNRIISGVSDAVVVVEAGATGGALITARIALEQGRDVCATPGDVGRESSTGCNQLIRDGAIPVHDADDLLETLDLLIGLPAAPTTAAVDGGVALERYLASIGDDAGQALIELGRREALGQVEVRDGSVWPRTG